MGFGESFELPPSCAMRKDFPEGAVRVVIVGSESLHGPSHVDLYAAESDTPPSTPRVRFQIPDAVLPAADHIETALREAHRDDCYQEGDYGCIALNSLSEFIKRS